MSLRSSATVITLTGLNGPIYRQLMKDHGLVSKPVHSRFGWDRDDLLDHRGKLVGFVNKALTRVPLNVELIVDDFDDGFDFTALLVEHAELLRQFIRVG